MSKHVQRLWQVDKLPLQQEKEVTRSNQDRQAVALLEAETVRIEVGRVHRCATPLLGTPSKTSACWGSPSNEEAH